MILIADSGSTKTDWVFLTDKGVQIPTQTIGFNPIFHSKQSVIDNIQKNEVLREYASKVEHLYFYGAGCSTSAHKLIIENALTVCFTNAQISVGHDLQAAAFACYEGISNITCILGTGANSCLFDGKVIKENSPALGFILGDEASGAYFGKKLVTLLLYNELPTEVALDFETTIGLDINQIIKRVYQEPNPNVFLASLAPFVSKHLSVPLINEMVTLGMTQFLTHHVLCFPKAKEMDLNFVGSIAHHFEENLNDAANELGLKISNINRKPIKGLVNYHINHIL
jgi:N-acetylglucosamine kinase-like BadF-type ATPase